MYIPDAFLETRVEELHRLVQQQPLGMLVTQGPDGLDANHLPFELDASVGPQGVLRAHVARANPVWKQLAADSEVLVVFRGDDAYISPSWYPSKHAHHRQVPTWNYLVVHARGRVTVRDDDTFLRGLVARLTRQHEAQEAVPWKMGDAPRDYIDTMLRAIVGLEIEITALVGKSKLSQNKDDRDRHGAADALAQRGHDGMAQALRTALPTLAASPALSPPAER